MYFGTRVDEATSWAILDAFVAAGGRTIDTANCYAFWASETGAGGQSEAVIGRWLAANPGVREELTIATKVGQEPRSRAGSSRRGRASTPGPSAARPRRVSSVSASR